MGNATHTRAISREVRDHELRAIIGLLLSRIKDFRRVRERMRMRP